MKEIQADSKKLIIMSLTLDDVKFISVILLIFSFKIYIYMLYSLSGRENKFHNFKKFIKKKKKVDSLSPLPKSF